MPKPRVVFDTNVFVRALINPQGINARLIQFSQQYALLVTEVLSRSDLLRAKGIQEVDAERLITALRGARRVFPAMKVIASRDPDDDKFLEAAIAGKADYLVTGDKDLRDIGDIERAGDAAVGRQGERARH